MHVWWERKVCSVHWSVVTLHGQVVSEAYREDPAGKEGARIHREAQSRQPSWIPRDLCLSRSVCWHSPTPLTFSLTPYQNVFLSHTPLTLAPLIFPPPDPGSAVPSCGQIWYEGIPTPTQRYIADFFLVIFLLFYFLLEGKYWTFHDCYVFKYEGQVSVCSVYFF